MKRFTDAFRNEIATREFKMPSLDMDIPNINMPSMNLGISESLSDAKAKLSSVISSSDSKSKQEEAKKKQQDQVKLIISLLDDVRLQCPQTHAGLVIVCTAATLSPLYSDGIRFTWFRMKQDNDKGFIKVDESFNGWYSPSMDDIGSKICVQIQDNYDEGLSRYLETGLIESDPLLSSLVEPAIEKGSYRTQHNYISMGIEEDTTIQEYSPPTSFSDIKKRRYNLSTNASYVELKDACYIEVDCDGIFIGLNNFDSSHDSHKNRIGLHLISSEHITVQCCQPLSIILTVKVNRESISVITTSNTTSENATTDDDISASSPDETVSPEPEENNIKKLPLICPWSYIRTSVDDSELPDDEGELEASTFASTLVLLEQFLQSIPETMDEIKLCISCSDRTERDCLAACIRALVCQRPGSTVELRLKSLPWRSPETGEKVRVADISETGSEMIKRLKHLEQDNFRLQKMVSKISESGIEINKLSTSTSLDQNKTDNNDNNNADSNTDNDTTSDEMKMTENINNNSSAKILELENKISILQRRELENIKIREELEVKHSNTVTALTNLTQENNNCLQELSKLQKEYSDNLSAYELLKSEKDKIELMNTKFVDTDSQKTAENRELLNTITEKEKLLNIRNDEISVLKQRLDSLNEKENELEALKKVSVEQDELLAKNKIELESLQSTSEELKQQNDSLNTLFENQKKRLEQLEEMDKEYSNVQARADRLAGEINHQNKRAESQAKDLKKIIKENALTITEYEKALTRKSEECQGLETRINQLLDMEQGLNERESISSRLNKGLSEISIPRIKIPSPTKYIGSSSSPSSTASSSNVTEKNEKMSVKMSEKMINFLSTKVSIPFSSDSGISSSSSSNNNNNKNKNSDSNDSINELPEESSKRE